MVDATSRSHQLAPLVYAFRRKPARLVGSMSEMATLQPQPCEMKVNSTSFIDLPTTSAVALPRIVGQTTEKFDADGWAFARRPHTRSISALASSRHSCKGSDLEFAVSA